MSIAKRCPDAKRPKWQVILSQALGSGINLDISVGRAMGKVIFLSQAREVLSPLSCQDLDY
jgi:hypothetical protein